ncbi:hypothetical protein A2U01_0011949 [Trifolium medium]|uniref:Uncharacterized protein n=1 Tax=Trifolium medium TaxID=97028 RepID=A0A392MVI6_9FABA|nr:hypothetical protein [Trifolium medium]
MNQSKINLSCFFHLARLSELQARQVRKLKGQSDLKRALARSSEKPSLGEPSFPAQEHKEQFVSLSDL